jgi:hypothetical protein
VDHIFQGIAAAPPAIEFTVAVAYMEIYMEQVRDLLDRMCVCVGGGGDALPPPGRTRSVPSD